MTHDPLVRRQIDGRNRLIQQMLCRPVVSLTCPVLYPLVLSCPHKVPTPQSDSCTASWDRLGESNRNFADSSLARGGLHHDLYVAPESIEKPDQPLLRVALKLPAK